MTKKQKEQFKLDMKKLRKKMGNHLNDCEDLFDLEELIAVFANDMSKKKYNEMKDDLNTFEIKRKYYSVSAWNDSSSYEYWKKNGKEDSSNYIQVTAYIKDPAKVNSKKLKEDMEKVYSHFYHWENIEEHLFVMNN